jgi:DNA-binding NarL/FixJ family response regulator
VSVDAAALGHLRAIVGRLQEANDNGGTSLADVVELAQEVRLSAGVTVDFEATPELGQPLVVVRVPAGSPRPRQLDGLTAREQQVAALIAEGLSNKEIAARLRITLGTVKHYVHRILEKTNLPSRVAIATTLRANAG